MKLSFQELKPDLIRLAGMLLAITVIVAGLLGFVNGLTKDRIQQNKLTVINESLKSITPEGSTAEQADVKNAPGTFDAVYRIDKDGAYAGVCVMLTVSGSQGKISLIAGVDKDNKVMGVRITSHSETKGLGSEAQNPDWLAQFENQSGPLNVSKKTTGAEGEIVAITGATITSTAVTKAVQSVIDFAVSYNQEGKG